MQIAQALVRIQPLVAVSQRQLNDDVAAIEARNFEIQTVNDRTRPVLNAVTSQDPGDTPEAWRAWWTDQKGYALKTPEPAPSPPSPRSWKTPSRRSRTTPASGPARRCGPSPGPRRSSPSASAIRSSRRTPRPARWRSADRGRLPQPARADPRIELGDETVIATGIHRFWKAAKGWVMARDLKPGDAVRTLGGTVQVVAVGADSVRPVYNLEVAEGQSFFVGKLGHLVHDNSLVAARHRTLRRPGRARRAPEPSLNPARDGPGENPGPPRIE